MLSKEEWYTLFNKVMYSTIVYISHMHYHVLSYIEDLLCVIHTSTVCRTEKLVDYGNQLRPF